MGQGILKKEHRFLKKFITHSSTDNVVDWMKEFSGVSVLSHYSNVSGGVAILFSKKI